MAAGLRQRHGRGCRASGRCKCPYEAAVYSKRDGKKIRKVFPTLAAATAWRDDARSAVRRNRLRAPAPITINEAAMAWLDGGRAGVIRTRSGDPYKPSAIRAYDAALRLRLLPELGRVKLGEVTRTDLQDLVDQLVASGLHASTIGVTLLPLRAISKRAMARGEVAVNPTTGLEMPAVRGGRDRIAAPDECAALLDALAVPDRPIWATAMYAGLRRGELMALRVEDVDLATGVIHVCRGWDVLEGVILPKSGKERRVPIAGVLRAHLAQQLLTLGRAEGLVFGVSASSPFSPSPVRERATAAWKAEGLEGLTLHECRHTFASLMIAAGVNAKGAVDVHGAREHLDHFGPIRARDARQRGRGCRSAGRLPDASNEHGGGRGPGRLSDQPDRTVECDPLPSISASSTT
jgi:integrase